MYFFDVDKFLFIFIFLGEENFYFLGEEKVSSLVVEVSFLGTSFVFRLVVIVGSGDVDGCVLCFLLFSEFFDGDVKFVGDV